MQANNPAALKASSLFKFDNNRVFHIYALICKTSSSKFDALTSIVEQLWLNSSRDKARSTLQTALSPLDLSYICFSIEAKASKFKDSIS